MIISYESLSEPLPEPKIVEAASLTIVSNNITRSHEIKIENVGENRDYFD